jgi:hypothetical protein
VLLTAKAAGRLSGAIPLSSRGCDDDQREDDQKAAGEEDATFPRAVVEPRPMISPETIAPTRRVFM